MLDFTIAQDDAATESFTSEKPLTELDQLQLALVGGGNATVSFS